MNADKPITTHKVYQADSRDMARTPDGSISLVVTSPPYPMIQMWDRVFGFMCPELEALLPEKPAGRQQVDHGTRAFQLMHRELDKVWRECFRVLRPGGLACINIGDATRSVGGSFRLFSNHARIISSMEEIGFITLPDILWRKQTNAPNKFMGSGMLPAGAYVTYEHEYILIFRKGSKRVFTKGRQSANRRRSAFFWEERNQWFSDVWMDLKGARQGMFSREIRQRSAAYPFELPYRLIQMYSALGDTVLDPFLGLGTTTLAAMASARNSEGYEIDARLAASIPRHVAHVVETGSRRAFRRILDHQDFVRTRRAAGKTIEHRNLHYGFPVITAQEKDLVIYRPSAAQQLEPGFFRVDHEPAPLDSMDGFQATLNFT